MRDALTKLSHFLEKSGKVYRNIEVKGVSRECVEIQRPSKGVDSVCIQGKHFILYEEAVYQECRGGNSQQALELIQQSGSGIGRFACHGILRRAGKSFVIPKEKIYNGAKAEGEPLKLAKRNKEIFENCVHPLDQVVWEKAKLLSVNSKNSVY